MTSVQRSSQQAVRKDIGWNETSASSDTDPSVELRRVCAGAAGEPGHLLMVDVAPCFLHLPFWAPPTPLFEGIPRGLGSPKKS